MKTELGKSGRIKFKGVGGFFPVQPHVKRPVHVRQDMLVSFIYKKEHPVNNIEPTILPYPMHPLSSTSCKQNVNLCKEI